MSTFSKVKVVQTKEGSFPLYRMCAYLDKELKKMHTWEVYYLDRK
jgi:hypothetical protein